MTMNHYDLAYVARTTVSNVNAREFASFTGKWPVLAAIAQNERPEIVRLRWLMCLTHTIFRLCQWLVGAINPLKSSVNSGVLTVQLVKRRGFGQWKGGGGGG